MILDNDIHLWDKFLTVYISMATTLQCVIPLSSNLGNFLILIITYLEVAVRDEYFAVWAYAETHQSILGSNITSQRRTSGIKQQNLTIFYFVYLFSFLARSHK